MTHQRKTPDPTTPRRAARRGAWPLAAVLLAAIAGGCVTEGQDRPRTMNRPAEPAQLAVAVSQTLDTNANGYPDTFLVVVYLFDARAEQSVEARGAFRFVLLDDEDEHIHTWEFPQEKVAAARIRAQIGPGYRFALSLLDGGNDQFDLTEASLHTTFERQDGPTIRSRGPTSVTLGGAR